MVDKASAAGSSESRRDFLAQLEAAEDPQQLILDRLIEQAQHADPLLGQMTRACAIPRRFDAEIIGVLRKRPEDYEENKRLLDRLLGYSFVVPRIDGTYVYHDNVRDRLLQAWRYESRNREQFEEYNKGLVDYYKNAYTQGVELSQDFDLVAHLLRDANPARYVQLAGLVESLVTAPLLEALYHTTLLSAADAFRFFEQYFYPYEAQGRVTACRTLLSALRDYLERLQPEQGSGDLAPWLDYFETRILYNLQQYRESEERLLRLQDETGDDIRLKIWVLNDLGRALRAQMRLRESRALHEEALRISKEKREDLYNQCAWFSSVAEVDSTLDELPSAESNYRQALTAAQEHFNPSGEVTTRLSLSKVLQKRGALADAVDTTFRALDLARTHVELRSDRRLVHAVSERFVELATPRSPRLLDTVYEEHRELISELGGPDVPPQTLLSYLECLRQGGQLRRAHELLGTLGLECRQPDEDSAGTESLFIAASINEDLGLSVQAIKIYDRILARGREALGLWNWLRALSNRGIQKTELARNQEAKHDLREAERGWHELQHEVLAAFLRVCTAVTLRKQGRYDDAQALLDNAVESLEREKSPYLLEWHKVQGDLCRDLGRWREAQGHYEQALASALALDDYRLAARAAAGLTAVGAAVGDWSNAARYAAEAAELWARLREVDSYHRSAEAEQADHLNRQGLEYLVNSRRTRVTRAAKLFRDAADLVPDNPWYYLNWSYANAELGEWRAAAKALEQALHHFPAWLRSRLLDERLKDYYGNAADSVLPGKRLDKLNNDIPVLRRALEFSPKNKGWADKLSLLEARRKWLDRFGEAIIETPPLSTPIVVEVSDALVPKVDDKQDQGRFIFGYIPHMRDQIENQFGLTIPGLRMRGNANLAPGGYVIMVDEIPVYNGAIGANLFFCTSAVKSGTPPQLPPGTVQVVEDPLTKEKGAWLSQDQVSMLSGDELVVYTDAGMLIRHIEVILCRHLAHFLGLQEVETLLDGWRKDDSLAKRIETALPDAEVRLGFARLLRTLVREQIPITAPGNILAAIEGLSLDPEGIASAVRAVRLRLRPFLPANAEGLRRIDLPPDLENSASAWLTRRDGRVRFDIPPQPLHNLLQSIRDLIPSADAPTVLVVRDPELRPFLQRMVDFSLPCLMVQATEEVLNAEELSEQALGAEPGIMGLPSHG